MGFDVVFTDAPARAGTLDFVNIDADFASQTARARSCGNRFAMLGSRDLAQLHRHGECRRPRLRLVGRQRLFLGFSLRANCSLKSEARAVLARNMFHGTACRASRFGLRWRPTLQRENHLPNFDLLAFFDLHVLHNAAHR